TLSVTWLSRGCRGGESSRWPRGCIPHPTETAWNSLPFGRNLSHAGGTRAEANERGSAPPHFCGGRTQLVGGAYTTRVGTAPSHRIVGHADLLRTAKTALPRRTKWRARPPTTRTAR